MLTKASTSPTCRKATRARRLGWVGSALVAFALVAGCGSGGEDTASGPNGDGEQEMVTVRVGAPFSFTDAPIFIADELGFFREEGIEIEVTRFATLSDQTALLAAGDLDVGLGSVSAGIVNAVGQGTPIKIVAGKGSSPEGYGYPVIGATELIESGQLTRPADVQGMRVGTATPGGTIEAIWAKLLQEAGLEWTDIEPIALGMPEQVALFSNGGIDASLMLEPFASQVIDKGDGSLWMTSDEIIPDLQAGVVAYGGPFIEENRETGVAFMRAYLRGAEVFSQAVTEEGFTGEKADEVLPIVSKYTDTPEDVIRTIKTQYISPDGAVNVESIDISIEMWRWIGRVTDAQIAARDIVDMSFVEEASD